MLKNLGLVVATAVAAGVLFEVLVPACQREEARRVAQARQIEADIVANLPPGGMTAVEVRDMLQGLPEGHQLSAKRTRSILAQMSQREQIRMVRLRADGSPARWYDGSFDTRWVYLPAAE